MSTMSTISFDYGTYGGPIGLAFFRDAITHVFHTFLDGPKYAMVNLRDFKELLDERGCGPCMRFMVHGVEVSADRSADQRDQIVFSDKPITQVVGNPVTTGPVMAQSAVADLKRMVEQARSAAVASGGVLGGVLLCLSDGSRAECFNSAIEGLDTTLVTIT